MWFPRLASDRILRTQPTDAPFALTLRQDNTDRLYCLNARAGEQGLHRGMAYADARAFCPALQSRPADPSADLRFQHALARWASRYCPWVGLEGTDGLVLNVSGSAHLFGGEAAMLTDMRRRLNRMGLSVRTGLAGTRGAAWALARFDGGTAEPDRILERIGGLPVAALRLEKQAVTALQRLGIRHVADLASLPRASVTRRFGPDVILRLDQALGEQPEEISPLPIRPNFGVRMTLPEPVGLKADVMAGAARLLDQLCTRLRQQEMGAWILCLTLHRVDRNSRKIEVRLARPLRDPARLLPLFERGVDQMDAGFGIDGLRLEATQVETLPAQQIGRASVARNERLDDLVTRIGNRIGLENIQRFLPAESHIPERSYLIAPAAYSEADGSWGTLRPRPVRLFPPEPIDGTASRPPREFRWRRMLLTTGHTRGPERIAPEWWLDDSNWRSGLRDYWQVDTRQGRRLWLFHTPQNPGWFVQGEFA